MLAFEVERNLHPGHASTCKPQCPPHHPSFSAPFSTPTSHRPIVPARSAETLAKSRVVFSDEVYHCLARRQGRNGASSKNDSCIRKRICSFGRPMGWETFRLVHMREPGCSSRRDFRRKAANHGDSHLVSVSPEKNHPQHGGLLAVLRQGAGVLLVLGGRRGAFCHPRQVRYKKTSLVTSTRSVSSSYPALQTITDLRPGSGRKHHITARRCKHDTTMDLGRTSRTYHRLPSPRSESGADQGEDGRQV